MQSNPSNSQTSPFNLHKALWSIFLIALAFRLWGVTNPLLDFHSWRQTLTADITQNYYLGGMNHLFPSPSVINSVFHFEFPLYTYLVAILYKVFGFHDFIGRVVAIAFSMGSLWFIYLFGKRYFDELSGIVACVFFAVLPFSVYYSRTFMPESAMLFFSISMLYMFARWLDNQQWDYFFIAFFLATCAFLVKLPTLYMGGPLLFLAWNKYRENIFYQPRLYLFVALILLPPYLWYSYVAKLQVETYGGSNVWLAMLKDYEVLLTLRYWKLIFWTRLAEKMFAFTVFPFLILGMIAKSQNKEQRVLHIWFFSVCAYFVIAAKYNFIHEYYQVPIIPVGCLFAGKFVANFYRNNASNDWTKKPKVWLVILMVIFVPIHSIYKVDKRLGYSDTYLKIAEKVQEYSESTDFIVGQDKFMPEDRTQFTSPQLFYFSKRKGWGYGVDYPLKPETLTKHVSDGATLHIIVNHELKKFNPELDDFLNRKHNLIYKDKIMTLHRLVK